MTPFIGVRISWLIMARNWLLARLACSAVSLAACGTSSWRASSRIAWSCASLASVMSTSLITSRISPLLGSR